MKYQRQFYLCSMIGITVLFFHCFPNIDVSTWSLLLMTAEESNFLKTWCRIQRAQLDVNELLGSCKFCASDNYTLRTCDHNEAATDINNSYISWQLIRPAGHFSYLIITTRNSSGYVKSNGGDYWKTALSGPSVLTASVFDLRNGSYEVVFLPVKAGRYKMDMILVYSLCEGSGVMEPLQEYISYLGKIEHYVDILVPKEEPLLHRLQYHMKFCDCHFHSSVFHTRHTGCQGRCEFLWDGHGTWENVRGALKWRPYIKIDDRPRKVDYRKRAVRKNGTLWFYGESQLYHSVIHRQLCEKIFKNCEVFYPKFQDLAKLSNGDVTKLVLDSIRILLRYSIRQPDNALILNSNFIGHLPFRRYTMVVDKIAELLQEHSNSSEHAQIIWSTMTSLLPHSHIYNAYTNHKMCGVNIPVLDIFPLTHSHPWYIHSSRRTNTRLELIFEAVERLLEDFFERTANR